ncbi:hypothetical protein [Streptomyces sp. NPDC059639]|uniref:hypothetical protein n=1 Tax=Streptomyces sp. NPDC059639 TaxID=3346891 RepID=UPI0036A83ECA
MRRTHLLQAARQRIDQRLEAVGVQTVEKALAAVAAHAEWGHQEPQQLSNLGPGDLVEGWADILRHRRYGCHDSAACPDTEAVFILDVEPGDSLVVPVTRISRPELRREAGGSPAWCPDVMRAVAMKRGFVAMLLDRATPSLDGGTLTLEFNTPGAANHFTKPGSRCLPVLEAALRELGIDVAVDLQGA